MLSCYLTAQSWGSLLLLLSMTCLFREHLLYPQLWGCSLMTGTKFSKIRPYIKQSLPECKFVLVSVDWSLLFCLSTWLSASRKISYLDRYIVFFPLLKDPNRVNFSDIQDEVNSHFQEFWKNICNNWKTEVKAAGIGWGEAEQYHRFRGIFFAGIFFCINFTCLLLAAGSLGIEQPYNNTPQAQCQGGASQGHQLQLSTTHYLVQS